MKQVVILVCQTLVMLLKGGVFIEQLNEQQKNTSLTMQTKH